MRNRGSRRHHSAVSRVNTSKASAGSVPTTVETRTRGLWSSTAPSRCGLAPDRTRPLRIGFERVELSGPEPLYFSQPAVQLSERLGPQAKNTQPCVFFDIRGLNEAGSMQQAEMPARSRCAHTQSGGNITGALRFAPQQLDNAASRGVGERRKRSVDVAARQRTGRHLRLLLGLRENPSMPFWIDRTVHARTVSIGRFRCQRGAVRACPSEMRVDVVDRAVGLPVHVGKAERTPTKSVEL